LLDPWQWAPGQAGMNSGYWRHAEQTHQASTEQQAGETQQASEPVLVVRNTFLTWNAKDITSGTLQRSQSDSAISSNTSGSTDRLYVVYETSGSSGGQAGACPAETSDNDEKKASEAAVLPVKPENQEHPSKGSALHPGHCRPCCYFHKNLCQLGAACGHCHYHHEVRNRVSKKARDRAKARLSAPSNPNGDNQDPSASSSKFSL